MEVSGFYGIDISLLENKKYRYFVKWYLDGAKKEEFKKWENLTDNMQFALDNYTYRKDVQRCIVDYYKRNRDMDFIKLYKKMLDKALDGDGKSADWILKAQDNEFFKVKSKSAVEQLIDGLNIDE